jgi:hypothetical protein
MKRKQIAAAVAVSTMLFTACAQTGQQSASTTLPEQTQQTEQQMTADLDAFLRSVAPTTTTTMRPAQPRTTVAAGEDRWDRLAQCECGGNWGCNTGNGYYGGLQMTMQAWTGFGGEEFATHAHLASREQQIIVGERILARMGWGAWPGCTRKFGWR